MVIIPLLFLAALIAWLFAKYCSPPPERPAAVYFIAESPYSGRVKIGKANNITRRLKQLQTGCPNTLTVKSSVMCKNKAHAYRLENAVHRHYHANRMAKSEWFLAEESLLTKMIAYARAAADKCEKASLNNDWTMID